MENRITLSKRVEGKSRLWVTLLLLCFYSFTWAQVKSYRRCNRPVG